MIGGWPRQTWVGDLGEGIDYWLPVIGNLLSVTGGLGCGCR
jgi:hypothetical protein